MLKTIDISTLARVKSINGKTMSMALCGIAFLLILFLRPSSEKFVVVDLHEAMSKPAVLLSQSHYSESEQGKIMQLYSRQLKLVLKEYGINHKKTIIESRVLSDLNHLDVTDDIILLTMEKVKHG